MKEIKNNLEEIQRLIVAKDPNDNDLFLRDIWNLAEVSLEMFKTPYGKSTNSTSPHSKDNE